MSMKKFTKRILAIVAAGVMTMGMAMPAIAAEGTTAPDTKNNAKEAYISKTFNTEVEKEMTFTFLATQVKDTDRDDLVKKDITCTIPSIKFETNDFSSKAGIYKKVSEKIQFGNFSEAGKYEYIVKENASNPVIKNRDYEKLIMSKAAYTMDVYVVENAEENFEISKIIVNKTLNDNGIADNTTGKVDIGNDPSKNGFNFVNTYVQEAGTGTPDPTKPDPITPDPDYTENGALKVSKKVIQNVTDNDATLPTEKFDFTAKFEFPAGTDANTLGGVKGNGSDVTLTDGQYEFQLANGENMKFTGLPVGTKITVTEAAKANYKASATVVINGGEATVVTATKYNEIITAVGVKKLGQKKNTVDVTNRYNNVPTTGIIMNVLPYVLMIALCGAALTAFVAFKRRRVQK